MKLTERQWITAATFALAFFMFAMAINDPTLWRIDLFKVLLQGVVMGGLVNMVLGYFYTANSGDAAKTDNTGKAFDAISAVAQNTPAATGKPDDPVHTIEEGRP